MGIDLTAIVVGTAVGAAMAITGSGGSIIGLPLIIHTVGCSIHDASIASLPIVSIASITTLISQKESIKFRLAIPIITLAIPAGLFSVYIKSFVSIVMIKLIIVSAIIWGLISLMGPQKKSNRRPHFFNTVKLGLLSGGLTGLTGLGGGLILVPYLKSQMALSDSEATATSALIVFLNSAATLLSQRVELGRLPISPNMWIVIVVSCVTTAISVSKLKALCPPLCRETTVKITYSIVALVAILGLR